MELPRIAVGGIVYPNWIKPEDFSEILNICIDKIGICHIDTAQAYHASEEVIGKWLNLRAKSFRENVFIASKCIYDFEAILAGRAPQPYTKDYIIKSCNSSLQKLGVEYLDLYYIHAPHSKKNDWAVITDALNTLYQDGKIKSIGLSNIYSGKLLSKVFAICEENNFCKPTALQNECHVIYEEHWKSLYADATAHQLKIVAYSPLASGVLSGKYKYTEDHSSLPDGSRWAAWEGNFPPPFWTKEVFKSLVTLEDYAKSLGHTTASISLAWNIFNQNIFTTIIGPRVSEHLGAVKLAIQKPIEQTEWEQINQIFSGSLPDFNLMTR